MFGHAGVGEEGGKELHLDKLGISSWIFKRHPNSEFKSIQILQSTRAKLLNAEFIQMSTRGAVGCRLYAIPAKISKVPWSGKGAATLDGIN